MKGVLASLSPDAQVEDMTHDLSAGGVTEAGFVLARYWSRYPEGTVHIVVVDPGVGTRRRPLAVEADRRFLVAPDNGVLSRVLEEAGAWRAVELTEEEYLLPRRSRTFHGRDVFAPAAAHLSLGVAISRLGRTVSDPVRHSLPHPEWARDGVVGAVVYVDRFGNLSTNLPGAVLEAVKRGEGPTVELENRSIPVGHTYGSVRPGRLVALVNSDGRVEVALRDGSARKHTGEGVGARVRISGLRPTTVDRLRRADQASSSPPGASGSTIRRRSPERP